jgi:hypothetical protein
MILNCQHELVIPLDLAEVSLAIALDRAVKLWGPELDCWRTEVVPGRLVYRVAHQDIGDVGTVELWATSRQRCWIVFNKPAIPTRRDWSEEEKAALQAAASREERFAVVARVEDAMRGEEAAIMSSRVNMLGAIASWAWEEMSGPTGPIQTARREQGVQPAGSALEVPMGNGGSETDEDSRRGAPRLEQRATWPERVKKVKEYRELCRKMPTESAALRVREARSSLEQWGERLDNLSDGLVE